MKTRSWFTLVLCMVVTAGFPAYSQIRFGFEAKGHYRDSESVKFPIPFQFPEIFLPPGESGGSVETVEAGEHWEISRISFFLEGNLSEDFFGRIKLDGIDRYDRNPTSTDNEFDADEWWVRYGQETDPDLMPEDLGWYVKLGKFEKFERQDDRNLESYGLVSTTFNRMEDAGLEIGADIGRHFYVKASYTVGNPLFMRDPNALAGDNGTVGNPLVDEPNPVPELKSGIPIIYDAEIEDIDFDAAETGLALGVRFGDDAGTWVVNAMAFTYSRELRETIELDGTIYGGDLDLLDGVEGEFAPLGISLPGLVSIGQGDDDKQESGLNIWVYAGQATFFGQYVDTEFAGLEMTGIEGEFSYEFALPWTLAIGNKPVLSFIRPAVRYSELDPEFTSKPTFPFPSMTWPWEKIDWGVNIGLYPGLMLTIENAQNEFVRAARTERYDELLATFSYRWFSDRR